MVGLLVEDRGLAGVVTWSAATCKKALGFIARTLTTRHEPLLLLQISKRELKDRYSSQHGPVWPQSTRFTPPPSILPQQICSVDGQRHARDPRGVITGQEDRGLCDVFHLSQLPPQRVLALNLGQHLRLSL